MFVFAFIYLLNLSQIYIEGKKIFVVNWFLTVFCCDDVMWVSCILLIHMLRKYFLKVGIVLALF